MKMKPILLLLLLELSFSLILFIDAAVPPPIVCSTPRNLPLSLCDPSMAPTAIRFNASGPFRTLDETLPGVGPTLSNLSLWTSPLSSIKYSGTPPGSGDPCTSSLGAIALFVPSTNWTDYIVAASISSDVRNSSFGFVFRVAENTRGSTYYRFEISDSCVSFQTFNSASKTVTVLNTQQVNSILTVATRYLLTVNQTNFVLTNGRFTMNVTNSDVGGPGSFGFWCRSPSSGKGCTFATIGFKILNCGDGVIQREVGEECESALFNGTHCDVNRCRCSFDAFAAGPPGRCVGISESVPTVSPTSSPTASPVAFPIPSLVCPTPSLPNGCLNASFSTPSQQLVNATNSTLPSFIQLFSDPLINTSNSVSFWDSSKGDLVNFGNASSGSVCNNPAGNIAFFPKSSSWRDYIVGFNVSTKLGPAPSFFGGVGLAFRITGNPPHSWYFFEWSTKTAGTGCQNIYLRTPQGFRPIVSINSSSTPPRPNVLNIGAKVVIQVEKNQFHVYTFSPQRAALVPVFTGVDSTLPSGPAGLWCSLNSISSCTFDNVLLRSIGCGDGFADVSKGEECDGSSNCSPQLCRCLANFTSVDGSCVPVTSPPTPVPPMPTLSPSSPSSPASPSSMTVSPAGSTTSSPSDSDSSVSGMGDGISGVFDQTTIIISSAVGGCLLFCCVTIIVLFIVLRSKRIKRGKAVPAGRRSGQGSRGLSRRLSLAAPGALLQTGQFQKQQQPGQFQMASSDPHSTPSPFDVGDATLVQARAFHPPNPGNAQMMNSMINNLVSSVRTDGYNPLASTNKPVDNRNNIYSAPITPVNNNIYSAPSPPPMFRPVAGLNKTDNGSFGEGEVGGGYQILPESSPQMESDMYPESGGNYGPAPRDSEEPFEYPNAGNGFSY